MSDIQRISFWRNPSVIDALLSRRSLLYKNVLHNSFHGDSETLELVIQDSKRLLNDGVPQQGRKYQYPATRESTLGTTFWENPLVIDSLLSRKTLYESVLVNSFQGDSSHFDRLIQDAKRDIDDWNKQKRLELYPPAMIGPRGQSGGYKRKVHRY
jgi:hypothetical protein